MDNTQDSTLEKRAKILTYFFEHGTDEIKPRDYKKANHLNNNADRTIIRNFQWFHRKWVIFSKRTLSFTEGMYDTDYLLTQNDKIKFIIPIDKEERSDYAKFITSQLMTSDYNIEDDTFIQDKVLPIYSMLLHFGTRVIRESILASRIYDNFKFSQESLLSILFSLSNYNQTIDIHIQANDKIKKIKDTIIKTISIHRDTITITLANEKITISSLEDIVNIFVVSDNIQKTAVGTPIINTADLIETFIQHPQYDLMKKEYKKIIGDYIIQPNQILDINFDKTIEKILKNKINTMILTERAKHRIKARKED